MAVRRANHYTKQVYVVYLGFRAHLHLTSWNDVWWLSWPMISGDGWGLRFLDMCLRVEGKPRKSQPGKLTLSGIEPGAAGWEATMLLLDHSDGLVYFVDGPGSFQGIGGVEIFPHSFVSRLVLWFTQPSIIWVLGLSQGIKAVERRTSHHTSS